MAGDGEALRGALEAAQVDRAPERRDAQKLLLTGGGFGTVPAKTARQDSDEGGRGGATESDDAAQMLIAQVDAMWRSSAKRTGGGVVICSVCGRDDGHAGCGMRYWIALRAAWLRTSEEEVAKEPESFEDPGTLQIARSANIGLIRELTEGELEDLEDCLDAVVRPFPQLGASVPLSQAVQCAEALWEVDD
mmetsp:Transcript_11595/g.30769  ORF Transcript_11595/g.30769 Transcript_11595/m.30769 type:complete len:191 (+) Transcript_11595:229-801(+)